MLGFNLRLCIAALCVLAVSGQHNGTLQKRQTSRSRIAERSSLERRTNNFYNQFSGLRGSLSNQFGHISQDFKGFQSGKFRPSPKTPYDVAQTINKCRGQIGDIPHWKPPTAGPKPSSTPGQPGHPGGYSGHPGFPGHPGSPSQPANCQDVADTIADILLDISKALDEVDGYIGKLPVQGPIFDAIRDLDEELELLLESVAKDLGDKCFVGGLKPRCKDRVNFSGRCGLPKCGQFLKGRW